MIARPYAIVSALIILGMFAVGAWVLHYVPVGRGPRFAQIGLLLFTPAFAALLWLVFAAVPWITPLGRNLFKSQSAYGTIWLAITCLMAIQFTGFAAVEMGAAWPMPRVLTAASAIAFIVMGNVSGKLRPNHFAGFRTPWALIDDEIWDKTQRFGGWVTVICGFLLLNATLFFDGYRLTRMMSALILTGAVIVMVASWWFARQKKNARRALGP
jgi:uncharacterized membrane protein